MIYPNKKYIEKLTGCNIIALKETPSTNDLAKKALPTEQRILQKFRQEVTAEETNIFSVMTEEYT